MESVYSMYSEITNPCSATLIKAHNGEISGIQLNLPHRGRTIKSWRNMHRISSRRVEWKQQRWPVADNSSHIWNHSLGRCRPRIHRDTVNPLKGRGDRSQAWTEGVCPVTFSYVCILSKRTKSWQFFKTDWDLGEHSKHKSEAFDKRKSRQIRSLETTVKSSMFPDQ